MKKYRLPNKRVSRKSRETLTDPGIHFETV